jgi:hypothetical protein
MLTGGWSGYGPLAVHGYTHTKTIHSTSGVPAHVAMPAVHRVASLLKRWLLGTHQGAVSPDHLGAYLGEFAFRFNRRSSRHRSLLFYRLLEQAVLTDRISYRQFVVGRQRKSGRPAPRQRGVAAPPASPPPRPAMAHTRTAQPCCVASPASRLCPMGG